MGFTAATIKQRIRRMASGGFTLVQGNATFATTTLSGDIDCLLGTILGFTVNAIGPLGKGYRQIPVPMGTGGVTATTSFGFQFPPHAGTIVAAQWSVQTTHAAHDTNFWTPDLMNKGAAGSDTTAMLLATDVNTTKITLGAGLTAYLPRALSLHGTAANLNFAANDYGLLTLTKAASAVSLVGAQCNLTLDCGERGENIYLDQAADFGDGVLKKPADGLLTFSRRGPNISSALPIQFSYWGY